jgi:hypothetical protein
MFKRKATDRDTQPTTTQQRPTCEFKNASLLPDGCCCLNDKGNEIFFRNNISPPLTTIAGLDGAGQWRGLPGWRTSHQWTSSYGTIKALIYTSPVDSKVDFISLVVEAAATIRQQPDIFERTRQTLLRCFRLCVEVGGHIFEHLF